LNRRVVLKLITGLNTGGAEMMLYKTVTHMDKSKYRSIVVSMLPEGRISGMLREQNNEVYSLRMKNKFPNPLVLFKLVSLLRKEKPLILHSYMFHADLLGRIAGKLAGVPIIISSIRNENIGGKWRERLLGMSDFMVDRVTAVCRAAGLKQVAAGTTSANKLQVIYNGIELQKYPPRSDELRRAVRQEWNIPDHHRVLMNVGRLERQKNQAGLLESFSDLLLREPDCTLLIAGDGGLRGELEDKAKQLGISNNVVFTGICKDIPRMLQAADIFVLSSLWEGLPNVVIEAMAARQPVIATNVGGTPEVVESGASGMMVEPGSRKQMAEAMIELVRLPKQRLEAMGEHGRAIVERTFTIERTIDQTEQLYEGLIIEKGLHV
jgi:glycosyltransferase involved in cell wall biosynthesis